MSRTKEEKDHASELRTCARRGHLTYNLTGSDPLSKYLRKRLRIVSGEGEERWLCLRCNDFVLHRPTLSGPLSEAPKVLRGSELRQSKVLRALAVERVLGSIGLFLVAYGIYRFHAAQDTLQALLNKDLPILQQAGLQLNIDVESSAIVHGANKLLAFSDQTLILAAIGVALYALCHLVEGVALWKLWRWGEWFAATITFLFLFPEAWELYDHWSWTKIVATIINVAAVVYLVYTKKLWPGGHEEYRRIHSGDDLLMLMMPAPADAIEADDDNTTSTAAVTSTSHNGS